MENKLTCFTIGHSNQTADEFVELLKRHGIKYLIDVRSTPYSKYAPQFNSEALKIILKHNGILYGYMGKELGARYEDPQLLFKDGRVDFVKVRGTSAFRHGIERIVQGVDVGHVIALMCSEKEPFDCHRFCLVSYELSKKGLQVLHILQDGSVVSNGELEERLLDKYRAGYNQVSLLEPIKSREECLEESYIEHNKQIGYSKEEGEMLL